MLALYAASTVWTLGARSSLSLILLGLRLLVTSVGVAAGIALWMRRPGAVWLAKLALMLFAIDASVRLSKRVDLSAIFILLHNAAWFAYLQRSRRVQAAYGLESQA